MGKILVIHVPDFEASGDIETVPTEELTQDLNGTFRDMGFSLIAIAAGLQHTVEIDGKDYSLEERVGANLVVAELIMRELSKRGVSASTVAGN